VTIWLKTFKFLRNFQLWFYLIFSQEIIQYSRTFAPHVQMPWNQTYAPLFLESFPKRPRMLSKASWFSESHKNKQNKQTTLLQRDAKYPRQSLNPWPTIYPTTRLDPTSRARPSLRHWQNIPSTVNCLSLLSSSTTRHPHVIDSLLRSLPSDVTNFCSAV